MSKYVSSEFVDHLRPNNFLSNESSKNRLEGYIKKLWTINDKLVNELYHTNSYFKSNMNEKDFKEEYLLTPKDCFNMTSTNQRLVEDE